MGNSVKSILMNRSVKITWKPECDEGWYYFKVIGLGCGLIALQGQNDAKTGERHDGSKCLVPVNDISMLILLN